MFPKTTKIDGLTIEWVGHSSVAIYGDKNIYIDPFSEVIGEQPRSADLIISTHTHRDHFDVEAINKITKAETYVLVKSGSNKEKLISRNILEIEINETKLIDKIEIKSVHAYNIKRFRSPGVPFHPEGFGMGVLLKMENLKFYYAGDTDFIEPMVSLKSEKIDVAFLPIGGTYTMDISDAVEAVIAIQPRRVIPVHYNHIKGTEADPVAFKEEVQKKSKVEVILLSA